MNWNLEEIKNKISNLELKILKVSDPIKKYSLLQDLSNLKYMANYLCSSEIYILDSYEHLLLDEEFALDMDEFIKSKKDKIILYLDKVSNLSHMPSKVYKNRSITIEEYDKMLESFLNFFNPSLYLLYEKYKKENRIELNPKNHENFTCHGKCHYILSENESYISSRFNNKLSSTTILPHEIAHAEQFRLSNSMIVTQNKLYSILCEAYPIFIEYAFLDFLKETEYKRFAYREEGKKMSLFICALEYDLVNIQKGILTKLNNDEFVYNNNRYSSMLIISNLVALYWLELYRENPIDFMKTLSEFNFRFGEIKTSEFFKKNDILDVTDGMYLSLKRYLSEYKNY